MSGDLAREQFEDGPGQLPRPNGDACIEAVRETSLPEPIVSLAGAYDRLVGDRDRFLWKWIHNLFDAFTLPCVDDDAWESVKTTKTALTMYVTALDDLVDRRGDRATFEQARRVPFAPDAVRADAPGVDGDVVSFAETAWSFVADRVTASDAYDAYADIFRFDLRQVLGAMEYSQVLNDNHELANVAESRHHGPHNMVMFPYADIDLMWSPGFDRTELGRLRSLVLELQQMARIGNWLTTWERELYEGDYTAGVVVDALERDVVTPALDPETTIRRIKEHDIDEDFEAEWEMRYASASITDHGIESFDETALVEGMRTVMQHHIASYGHK
jgi:hypothetical protein